MEEVTRILGESGADKSTPRGSCSRSSTTSCGGSPPQRMAARRRGRRSRRPRWSTRRTCGWSAADERAAVERPRALLRRRGRGDAPHPRRAAPGASDASATAAGASGVDLDGSIRHRRSTARRRLGRRAARPRRGADTAGRRGPAGGPAREAPLLRRADHRSRPPTRWASPPGPPTATGRTPGRGCSSELSGDGATPEPRLNLLTPRGTTPPPAFALWVWSAVAAKGCAMDRHPSRATESIFDRALEIESPDAAARPT